MTGAAEVTIGVPEISLYKEKLPVTFPLGEEVTAAVQVSEPPAARQKLTGELPFIWGAPMDTVF